ncbi:MAG: lipid A deacylase LpxR family protein [Planctomycetota bacterium]
MRGSRPGRLLLAASLILAVLTGCAGTGRMPPEAGATSPAPHAGVFTWIMENDVFTGSDDNYTSGLALSWATDEVGRHGEDSFVRGWADFWSFLPFIGDPGHRNWASWTVGHEIHTPKDLSAGNPDENDQPYAGILFVDSSLYARRGRWGHFFNLRTGVVGPLSGAEQMQQLWHETVNTVQPEGWDYQLPNEPVVNLDYGVAQVLLAGGDEDEFSWRVVPLGGASLGTYFTGLSLGAYGEVGWNLPRALGGSTLRSGFQAASGIGGGPESRFSASIFGGAGAFAVAHYLPLDGTVFRESRSVDSEPLVGSLTFGVSARYGRAAISFALSHSTETFEGQVGRPEYGTISAIWYF